jgi:hypothetical protein
MHIKSLLLNQRLCLLECLRSGGMIGTYQCDLR